METLYQGLSQQGQVLTFIYDTLIQDQLTMDRLRSYPDPMAQRHLFNEIDGAAVKTMMAVVEKNYGLAHDYFRLKPNCLSFRVLRSMTSTRQWVKKLNHFRTSKRAT